MTKCFEDCNVVITTPVAWGEMDAFQHVNNVVYFRYFESARIAYFEKAGVNKAMQESGIGPILASTQCRFKAPVVYPDSVQVATCVTSIEEDRFTMKYFVKSENQNRIAAEGEGLVVFYDYNKACKHAIPEAIKQQIMLLDGLQ
jgi:acyl-CoA thioester hydrolase